MHPTILILSFLLLLLSNALQLPRALPNAPDGYTPSEVDCPKEKPSIRSASDLSPEETAWLKQRQSKRLSSMKDLLKRLDISEFNTDSFFDGNDTTLLPNIGIAFSGGGYRALLSGGGALEAFDSRSGNATAKGQLGGLLQASTYVSGLSGGSWLVGSIFVNNFTTVSALLSDGNVWEFDRSILVGPKDADAYYRQLRKDVDGKSEAGFQVSITDYWGRALSYQLINATNGGPGYTWSSIQLMQNFKDGGIPMPLVVALEREPGQTSITLNSSVFEINPWELGTWDPGTYGFAPLSYIGSNFTAGKLEDTCIAGFDNAGFTMGTSSTLFNQALLQINSTDMQATLQRIATSILQELNETQSDIAVYKPSPFYLYNTKDNKSQTLVLVDGGEDLQNIPFYPLLQPQRKVDVIFAIDNSADTPFRWPNGTSMVATYQRNLDPKGIANGSSFPYVPDQNTFVNSGLNKRPTFFGCNSSNTTGAGGDTPLVVYIPNSPYTYFSNVSTFDLEYNNSERDAIVLNGYNVATMGNGSLDGMWSVCVGCAVLGRSFGRSNVSVPRQCVDCFEKYCWNGKANSSTPELYEPGLVVKSQGKENGGVGLGVGFGIWELVSYVLFVIIGIEGL